MRTAVLPDHLVVAVVATGFGRRAAARHFVRLGDRLRSLQPLREALAGS